MKQKNYQELSAKGRIELLSQLYIARNPPVHQRATAGCRPYKP
ncbi:MAG: hypothetical protein OXC45_08035 [Gemmatimonadetes bacterium]|nr:hypothetical protein [Gemmatimonadota bacterium]